MNLYIGHESQIYGVEEYRLVGGKGDGMRLLHVRNGKGLEFTVVPDRCADISRLSFKGDNFSYFSPCGYVAPSYYDKEGTGFLKSFTAGFLTTCGLTAVGAPCVDEGESLPLHGNIANTPAEHVYWVMDDREIRIYARIRDAVLFGHKLIMDREIICSKETNTLFIKDNIKNIGDTVSPVLILYHMNMGYPLLSEKAQLYIPSKKVIPRNERAKEGLEEWDVIFPPTPDFEEQCYYHEFEGDPCAAIFNPEIGKGLKITYDKTSLDYFTQWKMTGIGDYVLGLEPGNCHPDGRHKMREDGRLKFIRPGDMISFCVQVDMLETAQWDDINK